MAYLSDLPPELVLKVLADLPIPSLHAMSLSSQLWHRFFVTHESSVYHQAACHHRYVLAMNVTLEQARYLYTLPDLIDAGSWREFCGS